jgi:hypothetical protein
MAVTASLSLPHDGRGRAGVALRCDPAFAGEPANSAWSAARRSPIARRPLAAKSAESFRQLCAGLFHETVEWQARQRRTQYTAWPPNGVRRGLCLPKWRTALASASIALQMYELRRLSLARLLHGLAGCAPNGVTLPRIHDKVRILVYDRAIAALL